MMRTTRDGRLAVAVTRVEDRQLVIRHAHMAGPPLQFVAKKQASASAFVTRSDERFAKSDGRSPPHTRIGQACRKYGGDGAPPCMVRLRSARLAAPLP